MQQTIRYFSITAVFLYVLSVISCSKVIIYEPDEDEVGLYSKLYIPKAERSIKSLILNPDEEENYINRFNVYLGGPVDAKEDITVRFKIDPEKVEEYNEKTDRNYKVFPKENVKLEEMSAIISKGSRSTESIEFTLVSNSNLELFSTYVLPISIESDDVSIHEDLSTLFIVIRATYSAGEVPSEKVLSLGQDWGDILTSGPNGTFYIRDKNLDIVLYEPDEKGVFSNPPKTIGVFWDVTESMYYVNETTLVARNIPPAGLFRFTISNDYELEQMPDWEDFWLGDGWDRWVIIPHKEHFFLIDDKGDLLRMSSLSFENAPKTTVIPSFGEHKQVLSFKDYLLALKPDGSLWLYPVKSNGDLGTAQELGSGWNKYERIVVVENDILAFDGNGDVFRYEIDPNGFYPL